ncbi:hypothetical protein ANN_02673 [Periplaneta americana]|uniref:Uncharacterized protein n=1 Tax=Periplaneta americana TaxID=6978 RepID=A0ABQ8TX51_PERAM|nr:hypothetical protein ANN_02673 [Periplaneta americana]
MAGLCEGGNEPPGSLKANNAALLAHELVLSKFHEKIPARGVWTLRERWVAGELSQPDTNILHNIDSYYRCIPKNPQSSRRVQGEKQHHQGQVHDACSSFAKAPLRDEDKCPRKFVNSKFVLMDDRSVTHFFKDSFRHLF